MVVVGHVCNCTGWKAFQVYKPQNNAGLVQQSCATSFIASWWAKARHYSGGVCWGVSAILLKLPFWISLGVCSSPFPNLASEIRYFVHFFSQPRPCHLFVLQHSTKRIILHLLTHWWCDNDKSKGLVRFSVKGVPDFTETYTMFGDICSNESCCETANEEIHLTHYKLCRAAFQKVKYQLW